MKKILSFIILLLYASPSCVAALHQQTTPVSASVALLSDSDDSDETDTESDTEDSTSSQEEDTEDESESISGSDIDSDGQHHNKKLPTSFFCATPRAFVSAKTKKNIQEQEEELASTQDDTLRAYIQLPFIQKMHQREKCLNAKPNSQKNKPDTNIWGNELLPLALSAHITSQTPEQLKALHASQPELLSPLITIATADIECLHNLIKADPKFKDSSSYTDIYEILQCDAKRARSGLTTAYDRYFSCKLEAQKAFDHYQQHKKLPTTSAMHIKAKVDYQKTQTALFNAQVTLLLHQKNNRTNQLFIKCPFLYKSELEQFVVAADKAQQSDKKNTRIRHLTLPADSTPIVDTLQSGLTEYYAHCTKTSLQAPFLAEKQSTVYQYLYPLLYSDIPGVRDQNHPNYNPKHPDYESFFAQLSEKQQNDLIAQCAVEIDLSNPEQAFITPQTALLKRQELIALYAKKPEQLRNLITLAIQDCEIVYLFTSPNQAKPQKISTPLDYIQRNTTHQAELQQEIHTLVQSQTDPTLADVNQFTQEKKPTPTTIRLNALCNTSVLTYASRLEQFLVEADAALKEIDQTIIKTEKQKADALAQAEKEQERKKDDEQQNNQHNITSTRWSNTKTIAFTTLMAYIIYGIYKGAPKKIAVWLKDKYSALKKQSVNNKQNQQKLIASTPAAQKTAVHKQPITPTAAKK